MGGTTWKTCIKNLCSGLAIDPRICELFDLSDMSKNYYGQLTRLLQVLGYLLKKISSFCIKSCDQVTFRMKKRKRRFRKISRLINMIWNNRFSKKLDFFTISNRLGTSSAFLPKQSNSQKSKRVALKQGIYVRQHHKKN